MLHLEEYEVMKALENTPHSVLAEKTLNRNSGLF